MKLSDLKSAAKYQKSPIGSDPTDIVVSKIEKGEDTDFIARDGDGNRLGKMTITKFVITDLGTEDGNDLKAPVATELLRAGCQIADHKKVTLMVDSEEIGPVRIKRFLERFGFRMGRDGMMERVPGSALPPVITEF